MPDNLEEFAAKLDRLNTALSGGSLRQVVTRTSLKAKTATVPRIDPATLSHWGRGSKRGGYSVTATYNVLDDQTAELKPTTPPLAGLLEHGSGSTWKAPRRKGSPRRRKGSVGTYQRTPVPARHVWTRAVAPLDGQIPGWVHDEVQNVLRGIFG
jgi:hypothetical protein